MSISREEAAKMAMRYYADSNYYIAAYNRLTEEEKNELSIGGKTNGKYILENFERCMNYFKHFESIAKKTEEESKMRIYGKETKLYNVKAYRFGKCYGYVVENVSLDAALKYIDDRQGVNNWEYFTEEAKETENK